MNLAKRLIQNVGNKNNNGNIYSEHFNDTKIKQSLRNHFKKYHRYCNHTLKCTST